MMRLDIIYKCQCHFIIPVVESDFGTGIYAKETILISKLKCVFMRKLQGKKICMAFSINNL